MARASLRTRLAVALALTAVVSVAVTAVLSVSLVRRHAAATAQRELEKLATAIAVDPPAFADPRLELRAIRRLLRVTGARMEVVRPDGTVGGELAALAAEVDLTPLAAGRELRGSARTPAGELAYYAIPVVGARFVAGLILARPVGVAQDVWAPVAARVLLAAVAAALAAAALSAVLARRLVRPLRGVASAAERIASGDLEQRVAVESHDEVGEMAAAFNAMTEALSEAQRREREFLASVSHELRTPLTAIRGYAEALTDDAVRGERERTEALGVIRAEAARLERLVQDVMDLARLGARTFQLNVRHADLTARLREVATAHAARAADAGVRLEVRAPEHLPAETDPDRVSQIVANLLDNAIRVTPHGGVVVLVARVGPDGVVIEVSDTGPGIRPADRAHVFERSYLWRASKDRQQVGTGLGLAIVRELVVALGGAVAIDSEVGAGTTFRVTLPARASAPVHA